MTEERKQELRQLLEEAMEGLVIRYGSGAVSRSVNLPKDVYKKYLEERWTSYGIDFLSFWLSPRVTPDIVNEAIKSKLRDFIREELSQFIDKSDILRATYLIENGSYLYRFGDHRVQLRSLIERLLEIAIVRGIEEAVSTFDRCSRLEGAHNVFQHVVLLGGIKIEKAIEVYKGVRLIPLPSLEISKEVMQHLTGFPPGTYADEENSFFGKTLFIIERPGFSMFHEPSEDLYVDATPHPDKQIQEILQHADKQFKKQIKIDDLPFPVKVHKVKFPNMAEVHTFRELFCQALSLVKDIPIQIIDGRLTFYEPDKSFNPYNATIHMLNHSNTFGGFAEVVEDDIEEAKCLYKRLAALDSNSMEKLRVAIDRWILSKTDRARVDRMIDLGIALEALYVTSKHDIGKKLRHRASWYLAENPAHQQELETEFEEIYDYRSKAVHEGSLDKEVEIQGQPIPVAKFIESVQNRCRQSIIELIKDEKFPDWNTLRQRAKAKWAGS